MRVAESWHDVSEVESGIRLICEPHVVRLFRGNFFLVEGAERNLLVDTGMGLGNLPALLAPWSEKPLVLFTTHAHVDHIGGHAALPHADILIHHAERGALLDPWVPHDLSYDGFSESDRAQFRAAGFDTSGLLIDALPHAGFDPRAHRYRGVAARGVTEGEVIDLGNRRFTILHLPGHSPGSAALWDEANGTLLAGDVIYDGILVDTLPGSDIPAYLDTMRRLRDLPVRRVHGGHRASFGRERMLAIIDAYVASRGRGTRETPETLVSW